MPVNTPNKDKLDYFGGTLTFMMKRDVENAVASYLVDRDIKAHDAKKTQIRLRSLLKFLQMENRRWHDMKKDDMTTYQSKFMKAVQQFIAALKKKTDQL